MTCITDLKGEIIYLKEIVKKPLKGHTLMLANKVVKVEDKIKSLETQNNILNQYFRGDNVEYSDIPEVVSNENLENAVVNTFTVVDVQISTSDIDVFHRFGIKKKMLFFYLKSETLIMCFAPLTIKKRICPTQDFLSVKI